MACRHERKVSYPERQPLTVKPVLRVLSCTLYWNGGIGILPSYLVLFKKFHDLWAEMFSGMKSLAMMRWVSLNALDGSELRAARASGGLRANRVGTGPLAVSPSNMVAWRGHSAARTVATVSL